MNAALVCKIMGVVFLIVAAWGFIDGDRVLIFHVNLAHNVVHLASGIGALACGFAGERAARVFCFVFGAVYGLVAAMGLLGVRAVIDLLHLNAPDNWLHAAIAAVFLVAGLVSLSNAGAVPHTTHPPGSA